jgi:regulator of sirC expression with transglutaminase-like and TPR domain
LAEHHKFFENSSYQKEKELLYFVAYKRKRFSRLIEENSSIEGFYRSLSQGRRK